MKKWFISVTGLCVILLGVLAFLLISCRGSGDTEIYIYHFNPSARVLEAEARPLPAQGNIIEAAVEYIYTGPRIGNLASTWPIELAPNKSDLVHAIILESDMLLLFLSPVFDHIPPLDQSLFKTSLILTMESLVERNLPYVASIKVLVSDDYNYAFNTLILSLSADEDEEIPDVPWLIYDGSPGVYNDPVLSSVATIQTVFNHLHFVDETGTGLIVASYETDEVDRRPEELMRYVLLLLIDSLRPEGAMFPIPQETVIHSVITDRNHVWVDLSTEFIDRFEGDESLARLMIYSIVNTLIANFPRRWVNFMIDGRQHEYFHGIINFDQPFERDDTLLLSYILEQREIETWSDWE